MLAPRGAPRDGWAGERVFVGLLRAPGTSGPGRGPRSPPPSQPLPRVARPTEERALSLPGNPCPGQLGRLTGGKVCTVPPENSLGELPYCAPGSPPGWPWRGAGSVLSLRHPYPRMVSLAG